MAMTKQELFQAFREAASLEFAHIPRDDSQIQYVFSDDFEKRMKALIEQTFKAKQKSKIKRNY